MTVENNGTLKVHLFMVLLLWQRITVEVREVKAKDKVVLLPVNIEGMVEDIIKVKAKIDFWNVLINVNQDVLEITVYNIYVFHSEINFMRGKKDTVVVI